MVWSITKKTFFGNVTEIVFAAHTKQMLEKKEHVATDELRQLLTTDIPLSQMLADARGLKKNGDEFLRNKDETKNTEEKKPLRYETVHGHTHELQQYQDFLKSLITRCHLLMDARRESLRILIANQHKKHRITLMLNVEDLFANWFDVPIGVLIADAEKPHYITELEEQEEREEREEREKQESRNDDELRISST